MFWESVKLNFDEIINKYASDILNDLDFKKQTKYMQHKNVSVYSHVLNVARYSLKMVNKFNINIDTKSLIRGCLLHDYFLYDWHENDPSHRLHGFTHASRALKNANEVFDLNDIEKNMIYTHMFPLNLRLPKYKESIILCISDKICAIKEIIR